MNSLTESINKLWYNSILEMEVNFLKQKISFKTQSIDNKIIEFHSLVINNFSKLMWVSEQDDVILSNCSYLEITSISLCDIMLSTNSKWLSQFSNRFNLIIEIWDKALLISTNHITIDGIEFDLQSDSNIRS